MIEEFSVKGWEGMTLVDKRGDTTNTRVVYRYGCAFQNYLKCPFVVCIRIEVLVLPRVPLAFLPLAAL